MKLKMILALAMIALAGCGGTSHGGTSNTIESKKEVDEEAEHLEQAYRITHEPQLHEAEEDKKLEAEALVHKREVEKQANELEH